MAVDGLLGFHYAHRQVLGHGHVAELAGELAGFGAVPRFLRDQQLLPKPLAFRAQLGSLFTRIIGHAVQRHHLLNAEVARVEAGPQAEAVAQLGTAEDAGHGVIILGRNRIELVIVAARAADAQGQHRARRHVDHLIGDVHGEELAVGLVEIVRPQGEEPRRDLLLVTLASVAVRQQVAGDLLAYELVVGLVCVERIDHVVAVFPGDRERKIARPPDGFRVTRDVEPMAAPAFAETLRGKQAVDHLVEGAFVVIGNERGNFRGRRRQTGKVVGGAANQRLAGDIAYRPQPFLFDLRQNELVDRAARPGSPADSRKPAFSGA